MKKFLAVMMLILSMSLVMPVSAGESDAVAGKKPPICHDAEGKWAPQDERCDPTRCGCWLHDIEDFLREIFG